MIFYDIFLDKDQQLCLSPPPLSLWWGDIMFLRFLWNLISCWDIYTCAYYHEIYPVILLCPEFYCEKHFSVFNTILCSAHYYVQQNSVSTLTPKIHFFTFHMWTCCGPIMLHLQSTSWVGGDMFLCPKTTPSFNFPDITSLF